MLVICTLVFMINSGGINWQTHADIEGKILNEGTSKYVVDFRDGLKKYPLTVNPQSYNKTLIEKSACVKE